MAGNNGYTILFRRDGHADSHTQHHFLLIQVSELTETNNAVL